MTVSDVLVAHIQQVPQNLKPWHPQYLETLNPDAPAFQLLRKN